MICRGFNQKVAMNLHNLNQEWISNKKQLLKEAVLTQKIVVRLSKSVYRFYEPLIFTDVNVCYKQTDYRN
jgi:hypothetical protein